METGVKKLKQIVPIIPKYVISTNGCYLTEQLNNPELIQVNDGDDTKYNIEGIDGSTLIPIELGGRLIQPSISINELGKQLLKASAEGNIDEIKLLMNKGAPFTADWLGTSPLHFAAQNNHLEVCEILLRAGISKDARTKVDRTPLHMATYEGHIEIVRCLLQNKADIDCKDLLSMTPLHWAVQNSHAEVVELLLRHGARKDVINKFDLTAMDIAHQCKRNDIIELLNKTVPDAEVAVQHLTVQMSEIDNSGDSIMYPTVETFHSRSNSPNIPLETVLEDADNESSIDPDRLYMKSEALDEITEFTTAEEEVETKFSESMKLLREHGITMLPADDSNILSSIIETGHSVVLTDVGKEVLNSTKPVEASSVNVNNIVSKGILPVLTPKVKPVTISKMPKKIITMSSDEFLAMTLNKGNVLKQLNGKINSTRPGVKRVVMKRNKVIPITSHSHKQENSPDVELLMKQLIETRKLVEEYKQKFLKKEAEAEQYKQQLLLIAQSRNIC